VWHASVSPRAPSIPILALWALAEGVLRGVGDPALGEWRDVGDIAIHLRRRLTPAEMRAGAIAAVVDIRGTPEHGARIDRIRPYLPPALRATPRDQLL
jgi:hypothetical protein